MTREYAKAAVLGAAGGVAGAAAMAAGARVEQRFTHRPDSYVPAHTLAHLLGLPRPDADRTVRNVAMHYGTGAVVGALRGIMAAANLRGPLASVMFTNVRLTVDQTLENATGVGAPPWTWPRDELLIDVALKALYALTTGAVADALIPPSPRSSVRRPALSRRLKGFA
jgi:hypothetical protein